MNTYISTVSSNGISKSHVESPGGSADLRRSEYLQSKKISGQFLYKYSIMELTSSSIAFTNSNEDFVLKRIDIVSKILSVQLGIKMFSF